MYFDNIRFLKISFYHNDNTWLEINKFGAANLIYGRDLACHPFKSSGTFTLIFLGLGGRSQFTEELHLRRLLNLFETAQRHQCSLFFIIPINLGQDFRLWLDLIELFELIPSFCNFETKVFKEIHCNCQTACTVTSEYIVIQSIILSEPGRWMI